MVFIRKNRNFNTKTRFSCRKQQFTSKIVLYSGKLSFYQEKRKFYVENDVFQTKNIRNADLQWKIWFLSGKTEILTRKRGFLVENSSLHLKQYFIVENSVFIRRNENFTSKTMFSRAKNIRNAVLQWKRWFLSGKTEILTRKRGFLVENSSLHLKQYFIVQNSVFIRRNENFTSKTMFSREKILEMPFYSGKDGFYQEKQKF